MHLSTYVFLLLPKLELSSDLSRQLLEVTESLLSQQTAPTPNPQALWFSLSCTPSPSQWSCIPLLCVPPFSLGPLGSLPPHKRGPHMNSCLGSIQLLIWPDELVLWGRVTVSAFMNHRKPRVSWLAGSLDSPPSATSPLLTSCTMKSGEGVH